MRTSPIQENGITLKAYAGTTGVMLAMNADENKRAGLLGFAIERLRVGNNKRDWLEGGLQFPGVVHTPGELVASNRAPIQKFRWSDYSVYPDEEYTYTVHPFYGTPLQPRVEAGPAATVRTESLQSGEHHVIFNRAAAASQAFSRRFKNFIDQADAARKAKQPAPALPPEALNWLTRGLLDQILNFIRRAQDPNWAIDIAIYEYELPAIIQEVEAAHARGAKVRIVFHAKPNDPQTAVNIQNLASLPNSIKRPRITHKICHHKFIVLSQVAGGVYQPCAVLCGSTNFTENGVYRQANVVHVVERTDLAREYLDLFEDLFRGDDVKSTKKYIDQTNPMDESRSLFAGFSPRSGLVDLKEFIRIVNGARRDVLFCTAFNLYDPLQQALLGQPHDAILRYGLQNTRSKITGFHSDRTAEFTASAMLSGGLEGWLKESTVGQKGNILIHTKIAIVDFTSDSPTIISGSHNLSKPASNGNDENFLILRGLPGVCDVYGCELMRLYDHYRFRFHVAGQSKAGVAPRPLTLTPDDSWTIPYFGGDPLKSLDRPRFAGEAI